MRIETRKLGRLAAGALIAVLASAHAARAGMIYGTGLDGPNTRDQHWQVAALPTAFTGAPETIPYAAFVYNAGDIGWYGGDVFNPPQTGYTNADGTFYWIGFRSTPESMFPFYTLNTWLISQTFTVADAGLYDFKLTGFGDERLYVYVNGTVSNDPYEPTVVGGTLLDGIGGLGGPTTISGTAYLNAGTNTIYARGWDTGFSTGIMISQINFERNLAPELPTSLLSLAGMAAMGAYSLLKRRIRA